MKKISILLMLLMGVLLPWAASAQSVTIGEGTSTSQTLPANSYYNYAMSQQIYTADEINASGNITSIAFYNAGTSTGANNARKFDIYMAHTTKTDFESTSDWIALTDSDIVYHGTEDVTFTPNTWTTFTLNTQFAYNGTDNLVICVIDRSGDYTPSGTHNQYRVFSTSSEYQALYVQNDNYSSLTPDGHNGTSSLTGTRMTSKNQIILGGIQQTCAKPTNLTAALTQGNGTIATLSWTENGQATSWLLQVATNDAFTANLQSYTVNTTPSKDLTSLTAEQTYYARVQPACDNNNNKYWSATCEFTPTDSYSVTVSVGTSTSSTAPLYGNYNSSYDQMIYTASQLETAGITGPCTINKIGFNSSAANENARNPIIYICQTDKSSFNSTTDFISINEFTKVYDFNDHSQWNITAGWNEFELDTPFDYDGSSNLVVAVHCGMASYKSTSFYCSTTTSTQVIYAYHDSTDPIPTTYEGNWANYPTTGASSTSYKGTSTSLPSLKLYYEPVTVDCAKPTGLAIVGSPTAHGVTVEWNAEAGETFDYAIELGTGIDPETVTYAGSITATSTTCSMSWNNLMYGDSDYTVFIRKDCGNGSYSTAATKVIHTAIACPAPTTLACTAVTANTATLSWTENGSATAWEICLNGDETNPNGINTSTQGVTVSGSTVTYVLPNLTAETVYTAKVRSVCGGIDGESDWSNTVSFEPTNKITIGEATSTSGYLPTNTNYEYSYTQQIYTVEELGTAGLIESIDFNMVSTSNYTRNLDIYMVTTDKSGFANNSDWITVTDADKVFSGNVSFAAQAWTTITLTNPFIYDGSQNVAIIVDDNSGVWSSRSFSTYTTNATQSHYAYQDDTNIAPSAPSASNNNTTTAKNWIRILKSELSGCVAPTGLTATVNGGHSVTIGWNQYGDVPSWNILYQIVGELDTHQRTVFENPYTFTDLQPETEYTFRVCANCDDTHHTWSSSSVNATTDVACPAPTLQPVSGITNNSATISWTGSEAGSFNVRYGNTTTAFFEDFEGGSMPTGWTTIDSDNDGYDWYYEQDNTTNPYSGTGIMTSASSIGSNEEGWTALTPDNWLITPQLDLQGFMTVMVSSQNTEEQYLDDYFAIYLSTTGTEIADFTTVLVNKSKCTNEYVPYTADLSSYAGQRGYIAIRHFDSEDQFRINIDDFGIYVSNWQTPADSPVSTNSITLTGLTAETEYEVQVQADCGNVDGTSTWASTIFTTLDDCALPYELNVTDLTAASAKLNWTGSQDYYNVRYRKLTYGEPAETTEDFEHDGDMPEGWTMLDQGNNDQNAAELGITNGVGQNGTYGFRFSSYHGSYSASFDQYLISPELPNLSALSFAFMSSNGTTDVFRVGYSTTTNDVSAFTWGDETYSVSSWTTYTEDAENIPANAKYFAINYTAVYQYYLYIDDISYTCTPIIAGAWNTDNTYVTSGQSISGLEPETEYEWQVQGINCDGNHTNTEWSALNSFTTKEEKHFAIEGDWNVADNWVPAGLPEEGEDVFIDANATIPSGYLANVGHVTNNATITIQDGGQLRHTNGFGDDVTLTLEKVINGYGTSTEKDHYYFIAPAPFNRTIVPDDVTNMLSNDYDLYYFSASAQDGLEWINQESYYENYGQSFKLRSAHGYLYANSETVTLSSTGPAISSVSGGASIQVVYHPEYDYYFNGWELVGNPYVCNGFVYFEDNNNQIVETDFYRMNENGDGYDMISSSDPLAPYEGVFVYTENSGDIKFSVDPIASRSGKLNMNLTRNGAKIDMARVRFGEGQNLSKISFREGSSEIYMPVDGKDYASIFNSERQGEVPVSFKAEKNGTYNLIFSSEEVSFGYLHLIDNMTGADVDLLDNPSYTFEASTTDYESRFKLVFVCGDGSSTGSETFAFYSNGNWVISNDGNATLQVIDVNGRILKSESINGCAHLNINAAPGVYMLRLINGDNVKVQKVVVR